MPGITGEQMKHVKLPGFGITEHSWRHLCAWNRTESLASPQVWQFCCNSIQVMHLTAESMIKLRKGPCIVSEEWLTKINGPDDRLHQALSFLNTVSNPLQSGRDFYYWLKNNAYSNPCVCAVSGLKLTCFIWIHWSSRVLYLPKLVAQTKHWSYNR